jgi:hypothetical protein
MRKKKKEKTNINKSDIKFMQSRFNDIKRSLDNLIKTIQKDSDVDMDSIKKSIKNTQYIFDIVLDGLK